MPQNKELKQKILDAAFAEFAKNGFTATRVEYISERVNVSKGIINLYFPTKENLFEAMIENISIPFQEALKSCSASSEDPVEQLENFLVFLYNQLVDEKKTRELFRLVVAEGYKFPDLIDRHHAAFMEPVFARLESILEDGIAKKIFRPKPAELVKIIVSPIVGMLVFRLIFDDRRIADKKAILSAQLRLMAHGLLA